MSDAPFKPKASTKRILAVLWTVGFFGLAAAEIYFFKTFTLAVVASSLTTAIIHSYFEEKRREREGGDTSP